MLRIQPFRRRHITKRRIYFYLLILCFINSALYAQSKYDALTNEAAKLYLDHKVNEAIQKCSEAILLNPNQYLAYSMRGKYYLDVNQYEKAVEDLTKALTIRQTSDALHNRAIAYWDLGQYDKALEGFTKAIALNKYNDKNASIKYSYFFKGRTLYEMKQPDKAIEEFNKAIAYNQDDPKLNAQIIGWRAGCYAWLGKYGEASKDYETYLSVYPDDLRMLAWQGWNY